MFSILIFLSFDKQDIIQSVLAHIRWGLTKRLKPIILEEFQIRFENAFYLQSQHQIAFVNATIGNVFPNENDEIPEFFDENEYDCQKLK